MELYQLKTFVTVADEGHLTRAASRLNTSQPAVSAHVRSLEDELDVPLFIRTPKGMLLTREGETLKGQAEKALFSIEEIRRQAGSLKDEIVGTVKIGLHIDPGFLRIDKFLSFMQNNYPKIDFHLLQRWSGDQPDDLKKRELDAGFVYETRSTTEITAIPLMTFNIVIVGPVRWKDKLIGANWDDIANLPWIWTPKGCIFCEIASKAFEKRNLMPHKVTIADQEPVIKTLVSSGVGLAIMIEDEAREAEAQGKVAIWDTIIDTVELSFVYATKRKNETLIKAVLDGIEKVWRK